jgi:hypothetical protein
MKTFALLIPILLAAAFGVPRTSAQSCTTATCAATGVSESQFLAALPSSSNTNATVVVNIPSGSAAWTSPLSYSIPAAVTSLTIQGATTVSCTGTAGTSSYGCTAADSTIIQDSYAVQGGPLIAFTTSGASQFFRITGLTIEGGNIGSSSNNKYNGVLQFIGPSTKVRFDHNHLNGNTYSPLATTTWMRIFNPSGVGDHNVFDMGPQSQVNSSFGMQFYNAVGDTIGNGDGGFATPTNWGSSANWFEESNQINGGYGDDCANAGRFVMRYNTFNGATVSSQTHATKSDAGPQRGCRQFEQYHNYISAAGGASTLDSAAGSKQATALVWGNTLAGGYYRWLSICSDRNACESPEIPTPNGWGSCGTGNGSGSNWDGNQPGMATGYPCLDGIGRGYTAQVLNGANFPGRLNSVTGTIAWPQQYLEPFYSFMNSIGSATPVEVDSASVTVANQDYFLENASFNGTTGTGYGLVAARPSTCTAGLGGAYHTSPTGSYGVAYFATDDNGGQGELYVCTSTNTWTPIYEPYVYPHPLVSGSGTSGSPPNPATNLTVTVD